MEKWIKSVDGRWMTYPPLIRNVLPAIFILLYCSYIESVYK